MHKSPCDKSCSRTKASLNKEQQALLGKVLIKFSKLFDGTLGKHPRCEARLKVELSAQPVHSKSRSVAKRHEQVFKDKLEHLAAQSEHWNDMELQNGRLQPLSLQRKMDECNGSPIFARSTKLSSARFILCPESKTL